MGNTPPVTSINVWLLIGRAAEQQTARESLPLDVLSAAAVGCLYVSVEGKEEKDEEPQSGEFPSGNEGRRRKEGNDGVAVAAGAS